ncbi:membrane anchor subunit of succinate dehydrogenase, Sdh4 [Nothophoma quercina]|uniref:Membrane anchor subunit of succinate dehydrogenase, Sdh4 n=1 Tax=Nothophoma quercina TaxID=749835 RepID=A0ABR3RAP8_9PLEO
MATSTSEVDGIIATLPAATFSCPSCTCTPTTAAMASLMRPSVLRQVPAASQRMMSAFVRPSTAMAQFKPAFQNSTRVAAFHATQRNQILPPLPQKIIGTTNVWM